MLLIPTYRSKLNTGFNQLETKLNLRSTSLSLSSTPLGYVWDEQPTGSSSQTNEKPSFPHQTWDNMTVHLNQHICKQTGFPSPCPVFPWSFHFRLVYLQQNENLLAPNNPHFQNEHLCIVSIVQQTTILHVYFFSLPDISS